ncbi:hypothetical protein [Streptomyces sp. NRRL S-1022]|uniref:hypothetical protein n=1 Tax=Streptomyces sp. NRRL S-1022 TaxID=1463880 RepID=UPI000564A4F9|nr:hypothetical protein [Streptomyces sp. NRRL S-1022]
MSVAWVTGLCWRCDSSDIPVIWVGPAQWCGQYAPIYLCADCLALAEARIRQHFLERQPDPEAVTDSRFPVSAVVTPEGNAMQPRPDKAVQPVSSVFISFTALGVRAQADGRTGREAWRIIRQRYPRLALVAGAYTVLLAGIAAAAVTRLL